MTRMPGVAAAIVILDDQDRILMIRKHEDGSPDGGLWSLPGGKIEVGQLIEDGIRRETVEETCLTLGKVRRLPVISEDLDNGPDHHFVTFYFQTRRWSGMPAIGEPHKHAALEWFDKRSLVWAVEDMAADMPMQSSLRRFIRNGGLNHV